MQIRKPVDCRIGESDHNDRNRRKYGDERCSYRWSIAVLESHENLPPSQRGVGDIGIQADIEQQRNVYAVNKLESEFSKEHHFDRSHIKIRIHKNHQMLYLET
jgi:hypothetical protein